jgi:multicomponent Na+:H+ antiporter subunit F
MPMGLFDVLLAGLAIAMLVAIGRVALGPTHADRALGLDLGFAVFIAGLAVLAVRLDTSVLVNLVLAATLVGFLSTVAVAKLVERGSR